MEEKMLTYSNPNGTWGLNNGYNIMNAPAELQEALCRLRDYEKSGFSPESVMAIKHMYNESVRRCDAMAKMTGVTSLISPSDILLNPKNISRLFNLAMEMLSDAEEKSGIGRKDGDNDKL